MAGTKEGGLKARTTNREKYGENYYSKIGQIGGAYKGPKGFALNRDLAREAGAKGGSISRRKSGNL